MQPNVHPSADNNFWFLRRGGREKIANQRGAKQRKRRQRHAQMTPCTKKNERAKQEKDFSKFEGLSHITDRMRDLSLQQLLSEEISPQRATTFHAGTARSSAPITANKTTAKHRQPSQPK